MEKFNVLFFGDIVGEKALEHLVSKLPELIAKEKAEFVIANGENVWNGKGINEIEANRLFKHGVNVITTGNHIWENWKSRPLLEVQPKLLRPHNYPKGNEGKGWYISETAGVKIAVVQVQGRTYMQTIDCPFETMTELLEHIRKETKIIIVDFHAEATGEKVSMGWYLDGKVSAILGTHTHIQTADACILPKGTAYITDVGMTGPYDSVLGMNKEIALKRLLLQTAHKFETAEDDIRIAGVKLVIDKATGTAISIRPFMLPEFERGIE